LVMNYLIFRLGDELSNILLGYQIQYVL
jgi:hypothetical protein